MKQTSYVFPDAPYFDDYDPLKLYYKLLFKPKHLIQARELSQLQTILQEQIAKFGSHIFKNGSIVLGCESKINNSCFILSIESSDTLSDEQVLALEGQYLSSDNRIGQVILARKTNTTNILELVINDFTETPIDIGDTCFVYDFTNKISTSSGISFRVQARTSSCVVKFNSGILYFDGYFISLDDQKIVLSSSTSSFSGSIGFQINKVIKEFNGQDVLTIDPVLTSRDIIFHESGQDLSGQTVIDDFIEFIRVKDGRILKNISVPIYSELEKVLARRTFDQAGNFTVTPFACKVLESADTTKFKLEISPGKAYVLGYEFDSPFSQTIEIDKALDFNQKNDFQLSTYFGSYVILSNFTGFFDVQKCEKVLFFDELLGDLDFGPGGNHQDHIIGSARVRHVDFQEDQLALYLFEIQAAQNKSISDTIKSISTESVVKDNPGFGDLVEFKIFDLDQSTLLYELPEKEIRSIRDEDDKVKNDYYIQKSFFCSLASSPEPGSPPVPVFGYLNTTIGEQFLVSPDDITLVDRATGTYYHPSSVEALNAEATEIQFGIEEELQEVDVYAKVRVVNQPEIPLVTETSTVSLSIGSFSANQEYSLPETDIIGITQCSFNGTDILSQVRIEAKETIDAVYNSVLVYSGSLFSSVPGTLSVTYSYYKGNRDNGYRSIDSYPADSSLKTFKNNSKVIPIGKCIDFRVRIKEGMVSGAYIPVPYETFQCSYSYHLGRIDKLIATSSKNFEVVKGISKLNPLPPDDKPHGMTLYTITIPAKTDNVKDVKLKFVENRRYTMRDIGGLDKRIKNLEYYTSLSLLEKDTKDMEILDEQGNNRFKNGFLIDNFKNFRSVNYPEGTVKCSFNTELGELRPTFNIVNTKLLFNPQKSTCKQSGDLLTLPYSEVTFIEQLKASSSMNLQPFEVFNYEGKMTIIPEVDEWVDTSTKPAIIANQFGENDIWEEIGDSAFTAQWGSWESRISQIPSTQDVSQIDPSSFSDLTVEPVKRLWNPSVDPNAPTRLISSYQDWVNSGYTAGFSQTSPDGTVNGQPALYLDFKGEITESGRTGSQSAFGESRILTSSIGESVSNVGIQPFIRAQNIRLNAKYLKPNTNFYLYFDDKEVSNYFQQFTTESLIPSETPSRTPPATPTQTPSNTPTVTPPATPSNSQTPLATPTPSTSLSKTIYSTPLPTPIATYPTPILNFEKVYENGDGGLYPDGSSRRETAVSFTLSLPTDSTGSFRFGQTIDMVLKLKVTPTTKYYDLGRFNLHFKDGSGNEISTYLIDSYFDILDPPQISQQRQVSGKVDDTLYYKIGFLKPVSTNVKKVEFWIVFDYNLFTFEGASLSKFVDTAPQSIKTGSFPTIHSSLSLSDPPLPTPSSSRTPSPTPSISTTPQISVSVTPTPSISESPSITPTPSPTPSPTPTLTVTSSNNLLAQTSPLSDISYSMSDSTKFSDEITSDYEGNIIGVLYLPGGTFTTGVHDVIIRDSKLDDSVNLSSFATTQYTAFGLTQTKQETIISTREPVIISNPVTERGTEYKIGWNYEDVDIVPTPSVTPSSTSTPTPTPSCSITPSTTPSFSMSPSVSGGIFSVTKLIEDEFNVVFRVYVSTDLSFSIRIYSQDSWNYHMFTPHQFGTLSHYLTHNTSNETNPFDYVINAVTDYPAYIRQQNTIVHYITVQHKEYKNLNYPGPIVFTNIQNQQNYSFSVPLAKLPKDFIIFNWIDNETIRCAISSDSQLPYLEISGVLTNDDTELLGFINDGDMVKTDFSSLTYTPITFMNGKICNSNSPPLSFEPNGIFTFSGTEKIYSSTMFKHKWMTLKVIPGSHVQRRLIKKGIKSVSIRFKFRYEYTQTYVISDSQTKVLFDDSIPGELRIYNSQFRDTNINPKFYNLRKWWNGVSAVDTLSGIFGDTAVLCRWSSSQDQTKFAFYNKEYVSRDTAYNNQGKYLLWIYGYNNEYLPNGSIPNPYTHLGLSYGVNPTKVSYQTLPLGGVEVLRIRPDIQDFFAKSENTGFQLPMQWENYHGVLSNVLTFNPLVIGSNNQSVIKPIDPLAESFFVDEKEYPEGVFVSSIDVYFKEKSTSSPVDVQIRPNINGYPSSTEYLPFSDVILSPDQIQVSEDASVATRFTFRAPVYLKPGDYSFMVRAKDTKVKAWVAKLGEFVLGSTDTRITSNAYIGTLFKSANSSTWVAEGETDLKFRINRCSFTTTAVNVILENAPFVGTGNLLQDRNFSALTTQIATIIPAKTSIEDTKVDLLSSSNTVTTKSININETIELDELYHLEDVRDQTPRSLGFSLPDGTYMRSALIDPSVYFTPSMSVNISFTSEKETVSPVIDLQKLSMTTVENIINNPEDLSGELESGSGPSLFCYITKPVKLRSDTPANKLLVNFTGQIYPSDDNRVLAYYRIYNSLGDPNHKIAQKKWTLLGTKSSSGTRSWVDYSVETDLLSYDGDETIEDFDYFQIKLVGLSSNSAKFPKIKDFRTIALTA